MTDFKVFDSIETASVALAGQIAERLESAVAQRGQDSLVVSGGRQRERARVEFQGRRRLFHTIW